MESIFDAQFSLPHAISMIALQEKPGPEWMAEKNMFHNPEAKAIADKVKIEVDPTAEEVFFKENGLAVLSNVKVEMVGGKVYQEKIRYSKGTPNNPFTEEELKDKFKMLASSLFTEKRVNKIIDTVKVLEDLEDISVLTKLLKKESS
jgi:2-methylcitrate dehydratase PrpD